MVARFRQTIQIGVAAALGLIGGMSIERGISIDEIQKSIASSIRWPDVAHATTPFIGPPSGGSGGGDLTPGSISPAARQKEITKYGFPSFDSLKPHRDFVLSYDRRNRQANWVLEHLTPQTIAYNDEVSRQNVEFFADESIHPYFRSHNSDYSRSGFDRGHLAAAGNHRASQKLMEETFTLANVSPQVGRGFNRDAWNRLEKYTRYRAKNSVNTYVCTGPLYLPHRDPADGKLYVKYQVIGKSNVSVPTHFFKVMLIESEPGSYHLESYVMPNQEIDDRLPLDAFRVPIDSIERSAGLLFFDLIPKARIKSINGQPNR